jgi:tRNA A37 methylthiotransferase MiaB
MAILYNPASSAQRKPVLPMSLLALGAVLEGEQAYTIVDGNLEPDPVGVIDEALSEGGDGILGVTVMPGPQVGRAVPDCRLLKARHPDATIVWGGYFPTQHYDVCVRAEYVDYVVRGHGDLVFRDLVLALRRGEDPQGLTGVACEDPRTGEVSPSEPAPVPDLNELPGFPYHQLDVGRYARPTFLGQRTLSHHSSYGCPFACTFCAVQSIAGGCWRAESPDRTAAAVRRLVTNWGADAIEFFDNNFFVHEARTAAFAEQITNLNVAWWGESRIDTLLGYSERTWRLLRDSGLRMVFMGAESGSDETLQRMNKGGGASTAKTLALAEKMKAYGIVPEYSFVVGNPPDPEGDAQATISFIRKLKRINPETEVVLYAYTPVPSAAPSDDQEGGAGFEFPHTLEAWVDDEWQTFAQRRSGGTAWLSDSLLRTMEGFELVLNAQFPTVTDAGLQGWRRWLLRAASAWRYGLGRYDHPWELKLLRKLFPYQRPETAGF